MVKSVKITPDCKVVEVSQEEEDKLKSGRNWDGRSLLVPEHWKNDRKFRLSLSFPDMYEDSDTFNPLATRLLYDLRHPTVEPTDVICGTAFLSNETFEKLIDFTKEGFRYIINILKRCICLTVASAFLWGVLKEPILKIDS